MLSRALSGPLRRLAAASAVGRAAPVASLRAPIAVRAISDTSRSWADALNRPLSESDPELSDVIEHEKKRQRDNLVLIASENFASRAVYDALGSVMSNKYSEGYPGARYYGGNEHIDEAENLCRARALEAFGLDPSEWGVNVQPLSGSPANFQVYTALLKPHDRLMGLDLPHGGHLSHGYELPTKKISAVSTYFEAMPYRLDEATGTVDHDALARSALLFRPKLIIAGASAYSRLFDHARFREVADSVGAVLMSDMAHVSGLVAAGVIPSPFEHCDVVTTTTHKSLRGPRGAMIFFRKGVRSVDKKGNKTMWDLEERINFAVFPGHQGGPHNHTISALATALKQAADPSFKAYQTQVVKNAAAFARALMAAGCDLVSGGTDNHLLLVDLRSQGIDGARLEVTLEKANITTNKNTVPGDTSALTPHGLRLGSPAMTTRGATEEDFEKIAAFIARGIEIVKAHKASLPSKKVADYRASLEDPAAWPAELTALREEVTAYSQSFPTVGYTVDEMKFK